ncbi:hypothetical protein N182_28550 [Sinorhizobium sp. GL2]|nr:hypothetical protein N182_28550 [Sinorhizobium sp. GL2]
MPMTIYKFAVCENQEWIVPVSAEDFETFFCDGRTRHPGVGSPRHDDA